MKLYSTVLGMGQAEQVIEKSRFITYVKPVDTKEEADAFVGEIRKKHKDATHNVPAMVLGDHFQVQWASDDGEPQGTSGAPMVGTGGLVRAYTSSAKQGLAAAGICDVQEMQVTEYRVDYAVFNKIQNSPFTYPVKFANIVYADAVTFELVTNPEDTAAVSEVITGLSGGRAEKLSESVRYEKVRREN